MPEDINQPKRNKESKTPNDLFTPEIKVYPNPTDGILQVEYNFETLKQEGIEILMKTLGYTPEPNCESGSIYIYSNNGQLMETIPLYNLEEIKSIDISSYPTGIYILEIKDCYKNSKSLKITKQ